MSLLGNVVDILCLACARAACRAYRARGEQQGLGTIFRFASHDTHSGCHDVVRGSYRYTAKNDILKWDAEMNGNSI